MKRRIIFQSGVSILLIAVLLYATKSSHVLASLSEISASTILLATICLLIVYLLSSLRWQILLKHLGISEKIGYLVSLYFVGQFFSLFLPTSAGGDLIRAYEVSRRHSNRTFSAIAFSTIATLQERLTGLGASLAVGFVMGVQQASILPEYSRLWILVILGAGAVVPNLLLYPAFLATSFNKLRKPDAGSSTSRPLPQRKVFSRTTELVDNMVGIPALSFRWLVVLYVIGGVAYLFNIVIYCLIAQSLLLNVQFKTFCMIVPLVWVVRMMPISLNGIGAGEGALVYLLSLVAVAKSKALALGLAVFGVSTVPALIGGLILIFMLIKGKGVGVPMTLRAYFPPFKQKTL